jgi:tRNA threonylcarbamoyladenosine modification (KEOPS) complex  Pcc1 subunit
MKAEAKVTLCLGESTLHVLRALEAEASQPVQPAKGHVKVVAEEGCVSVYLTAQDVNGLRAILNSYLYLVHAAYSSLRKLEKATSGHRL